MNDKNGGDHSQPQTDNVTTPLDSLNLLEQFEQQWRRGGRPRIEDFVRLAPEPRRATLLTDLIAIEVQPWLGPLCRLQCRCARAS